MIFLSSTDHVVDSFYERMQGFAYWSQQTRESAIARGKAENERRAGQFRAMIAGKKWLDVGAGAGGLLELLGPDAREAVAVEPQEGARAALKEAGWSAYDHVSSVPDSDFDVVTLSHVLEHLRRPLEILEHIRGRMTRGGRVIVEVPHAEDFLISYLGIDEFKAFTFWSQHLILHTRQSLRALLEFAGFSKVVIVGVQRYPLANHLYWLARQRPGGHEEWGFLRSSELDAAYGSLLASLNMTDTLLAIAEVGDRS